MKYRHHRGTTQDVFTPLFNWIKSDKKSLNACVQEIEDKKKKGILNDDHFYNISISFERNIFSIKYHFPKSLLFFNRKRPDLLESYSLSSIQEIKCVKSFFWENIVYVYIGGEKPVVFGFRERVWSAFSSHCIECGDEIVVELVSAVPFIKHNVDSGGWQL